MFRQAFQCIQKPILAQVLLGTVVLFFSSCTPPPKVVRGNFPIPEDAKVTDQPPGAYGGIFVLNETSQPKTFNPQVPHDLSTSTILDRLLSSLIEYNPRTQSFEPALAKAWEITDDGKSYTFHLRRDILWSDGELFSADDVIFTFDAILAEDIDPDTGKVVPRYPSRYYEQYIISGEKIEYFKVDDFTVRFDLPSVYAPFIYDIGQPIIPKHKLYESFEDGSFTKQWSTQVAIETPDELVGTGPFIVYSYTPGERLVLKPNPHYWKVDQAGQRLPYVDYLVLKFVGESNTAIAHFATGKSDASGIGAADYVWVKEAAETYDFKIYERGPSASVNFFWFNQHLGSDDTGKPYLSPHKRRWFTDKRFRQAVQYGLDRQGMVDALLFGKGEPLTSIIPPAQGKWHNLDLPKYEFDPEKSRALLRDAGFSWSEEGGLIDQEGVPVEFELLAVDSAFYHTIAVTFVENMKALGMKVNMSPIDFATLLARTDNTFDYDATFLGWGSNSAAYDPSGSKALYLSSGKYHQWYPEQPEPATEWEAKIDDLIRKQEKTLDPEVRYAIMHEVQAILAEELPLLYIFSPYGYVGIKNKWQNIYVPGAGSGLWNMEEIWDEGSRQP